MGTNRLLGRSWPTVCFSKWQRPRKPGAIGLDSQSSNDPRFLAGDEMSLEAATLAVPGSDENRCAHESWTEFISRRVRVGICNPQGRSPRGRAETVVVRGQLVITKTGATGYCPFVSCVL